MCYQKITFIFKILAYFVSKIMECNFFVPFSYPYRHNTFFFFLESLMCFLFWFVQRASSKTHFVAAPSLVAQGVVRAGPWG